MAIEEAQLTTWARIGAQETSKTTYASIKSALDSPNASYQDRSYDVFLQGSYGNDTKIWKESDVDVVIRLNSVFSYDDTALPPAQQAARKAAYSESKYTHEHFIQHVRQVLHGQFKGDAKEGTKAVTIAANGNRRKADVLIALQHRRYVSFDSIETEKIENGIAFWKSDGTRVINYPSQHRDNLTAKNQATGEWFKHLVRIFKNARQRMLQEELIEPGVAPSYYIEGLLYNVPVDRFGTTYAQSMEQCLDWLSIANHAKFRCANNQYPLLDGNADVTWNSKNCTVFVDGLVALWDAGG